MAKDSCYWDIEIAWIESLHPLLFNSRDCREKCLSGVFSACFSLVRLHHGILPSKCVFASSCSNNAAIHLAPPFTRVASDLIVQSFIAPVHGICLEYKQTWMYQVYYTVCNENNMLEITLKVWELDLQSSQWLYRYVQQIEWGGTCMWSDVLHMWCLGR